MMYSSRSSYLPAFAALLSLVTSESSTICYSYGVDFVDEGHYFINSQLTEDFSSVSYFQGCESDVADVLLVAPEDMNSEEYICDQMSTVPENEHKTSICPIQKNQMESGNWLLLIFGNNGDDGQPFAWQRDLYLTVGTPVTSTITPTVTFSVTSTPVLTQTSTSTLTDTITTGPLTTVTLPSGTATNTETVTPSPVTTTSTDILTTTQLSSTTNLVITTETYTATCTTASFPGVPDKPCTYSPTKEHPAALVTPTTIPKLHRFIRKADRAVDIEWARARIEAAKQRRAKKAREVASPLERRAPDASVVTVTDSITVNTTTTFFASTTTATELVLTSTTTTLTLPPATVYSGLLTSTVTLPTPTETSVSLGYTTTTEVVTLDATITSMTTVTPTGTVTAC